MNKQCQKEREVWERVNYRLVYIRNKILWLQTSQVLFGGPKFQFTNGTFTKKNSLQI